MSDGEQKKQNFIREDIGMYVSCRNVNCGS